MIAYKVCSIATARGVGLHQEDGRFYSFCEIQSKLEYAIGLTTKPREKDGPLCCFRSLEDVKHFLMSTVAHVFEAEVKPSELYEAWSTHPLWGYMERQPLSCMPNGTLLCEEVTLLRKVDLTKETT